MRRRWRFIPRTALGKTRLAALLFAGAASLPQLLQVRPELPAATRLAGGLALALLPADFAVTYAAPCGRPGAAAGGAGPVRRRHQPARAGHRGRHGPSARWRPSR